MSFRSFFLLPALLLAAACGSGGGASSGNGAAAAPVAGATPPAGRQWTEVVTRTADSGWRMGNPDAPIKLIEYGSRTCPVCGAFARAGMDPLENQYVKSGKVSYEFRDFLVHAPDLGVAALGECVPTEAFFPVLEQMYQQQPQFLDKLENPPPADFQQKLQSATPQQGATMWVDYLGYIPFMQQRGLPEQKARACLSDGQKLTQIGNVTEHAMQDMNVTGTPTFFINGQQQQGVITWAQLEAALKAAGA